MIAGGFDEVWDCYWLVKGSRNHCPERNSFPPKPWFFVSSYANWDYGIRVFLPCPPSWKKLHWPLLSIASICEQLSLLQMEMRPKIVTNGAMPLNTDVLRSAPRVHMPDQINSNPSTDRTDISFTNPLLQQFVWSQGPRTNCMSTRSKSEVMLSNTWRGQGASSLLMRLDPVWAPRLVPLLCGFSPSLLVVWQRTPAFFAVILRGQGWEATVIEGWKNSGRGVEGKAGRR